MALQEIGTVAVANDTFNKLWGVTVNDYTYGGEKSDFETLLVRLSTQRAQTIEEEIEPISTIVTRRNEQLKKLGDALADLSRAQALFTDESEQTDTESISTATAEIVIQLAKDAGSTSQVVGKSGETYTVTKSQCEMAIQLVKSKMDKLNNDSQSDMTRLQSLVDKRDESFNTASSLMSSVSDTRGNAIKNMM